MKLKIKNPIYLLKQRKFTLPQIGLIVVVVAGLAFGGGRYWQMQQKARLAREAAASQAEKERLDKLKQEAELAKIEREADKKTETTPPEEPKPAPAPAPAKAYVSLKGSQAAKGVNLTWSVSGYSTSQGFKLLLSKEGTPVFGGANTDATYIKDANSRSYTWSLTSGKTYNFRVCVYNGSGCSAYSNTVTVASPYIAPTPPTGILSLSSTGGANVAWTNTGSALYGYKLVWSTSPNPEYPGAPYKQFYEKTATSGSIAGPAENPTPSDTYYVRICMYYESSCLNYSAETVTITLP